MLTRAYSTKYNECMTFPRCIVLTQYVCVFFLSSTPKAMLFTTLPFPIICFISALHFLSLSSIFVVVGYCCCFWKTAAETTNNNNKSIVATTKLQLLSGKICWIFLYSIGSLCVQTVCVGAHWIVKRKSSALNRLFSQSVVVVHDNIEKRKKPAYLTLPNWMEMCVIRITMKQKSPSSSYCLHFPLLLSTCFNQNQAYLFVGDVVVVVVVVYLYVILLLFLYILCAPMSAICSKLPMCLFLLLCQCVCVCERERERRMRGLGWYSSSSAFLNIEWQQFRC